MSLILDELNRLDRERPIRPSGMVKVAESFLRLDLPHRGKETLRHIAALENAFLHICEMISAHSDLREVLWEIVKECLFCVRAHRATISMMDSTREGLRGQSKFIYSFDHQGKEVYGEEEQAVVRESFEQQKPILLQKEDLLTRFPVRRPDREFTAIMTFPFLSRNQPVGILSAVLFNAGHGFDERRLRLFSGFARLASIAMEMDDLFREVRQGAGWRRDLENYLDKILTRLGTAPGK